MKRITDNWIGDSGAKIIGEALNCNTTLTELNLSGDCWYFKNT